MSDATGSGFPLTLLYVLIATAVVLVLAWAVLRFVARLLAARPTREGRLRVVQSVPVGARERVVVLRDDTAEYVVGVASGGVRLLERRERAAEDAIGDDPGSGSGDGSRGGSGGRPAAKARG